MPIVLDGALSLWFLCTHLSWIGFHQPTKGNRREVLHTKIPYYFDTWTWKGLWRTWAHFVSRRCSSTESKCVQSLEWFLV